MTLRTPMAYTASASAAIVFTGTTPALPQESWAIVFDAREQFQKMLEQYPLIQEIGAEILRLGLKSPSGTASTVSLLEQADKAFKIPSVPGVSTPAVLISLREAILRTLADLLPKRPTQEKTKGDQGKVLSIFSQCSRSGLDATVLNSLADEAHNLIDLLSAKQKSFTRSEVRELMNRGLVFLRAFLRSLDEKKMR